MSDPPIDDPDPPPAEKLRYGWMTSLLSPTRQGDVTSVVGALLSKEYLPTLLLTLVSAFGIVMLTGIAHEQVGIFEPAHVQKLRGGMCAWQ